MKAETQRKGTQTEHSQARSPLQGGSPDFRSSRERSLGLGHFWKAGQYCKTRVLLKRSMMKSKHSIANTYHPLLALQEMQIRKET